MTTIILPLFETRPNVVEVGLKLHDPLAQPDCAIGQITRALGVEPAG